MNGVCAPWKAPERPLAPPPCEDTARGDHLCNRKCPVTGSEHDGVENIPCSWMGNRTSQRRAKMALPGDKDGRCALLMSSPVTEQLGLRGHGGNPGRDGKSGSHRISPQTALHVCKVTYAQGGIWE